MSAGLDNNLRADLLMEAIIEKYDFNVKILSIHRKALTERQQWMERPV